MRQASLAPKSLGRLIRSTAGSCLASVLLLTLFAGHCSAAKSEPNAKEAKPLAITHVTVFDWTGADQQVAVTVLIEGGQITKIGKSGKTVVPAGAQKVDGRGKFLILGPWDMHTLVTHDDFANLFLGNGVIGARQMGSFNPSFSAKRERQDAAANESVLRDQIEQARIDTRRKAFDERRYERQNTPTLEDERERSRSEELRRARNNPPLTEIWSGKSLNVLIAEIQKTPLVSESSGPSIPLDDDVMKHINVTSGATLGSLGVLKDAGKLHWPLPLMEEAFESNRKRLDELAPQAVQQGREGGVDPKVLRDIKKAIAELQEELAGHVGNLKTKDYISSKRFLKELDSSIQTLQDPNISKYVSGAWSAKANSVTELVERMRRQGLKFAPAVDGNEAAYVTLHGALVAYGNELAQITTP